MDSIIIKVDERLEGAGSVLPIWVTSTRTPTRSATTTSRCRPASTTTSCSPTPARASWPPAWCAPTSWERATAASRTPSSTSPQRSTSTLFEAPAEEELNDDEDEVDFSLVSDDDTIDLAEPIFAAILMETPYVVLCRRTARACALTAAPTSTKATAAAPRRWSRSRPPLVPLPRSRGSTWTAKAKILRRNSELRQILWSAGARHQTCYSSSLSVKDRRAYLAA